ncbi:class I adenylate-forming enzyme family protein [Alcaligenaceae bacterium B3P038]|nr:class I adenylate-forming enzyme family protein [Alcaligenaceae bacterium B3P038]
MSDWVQRTPHAPALSAGAITWTYAQLHVQVEQATIALEGWGIRAGDRIALVGENSLALAVLILAAGRLDAWAVLENARRAPAEVDAILALAQPRRAVFVLDASPDAEAHGDRYAAEPVTTSFGRVALGPLDDAAPEVVHDASTRQIAALIYTTGSTGTPKGVMLTHGNLLHIGRTMRTLRRVTAADRVYGVLPITHVMGLSSGLIGTLSSGAHLRLVARFAAAHCLAALRDEAITILQGAPAMFARLIQDAAATGRLGPALRFIAVGGAPLDPSLKDRVEAAFGLPLHNGYGLTEASGTCWTQLDMSVPDCSVGPPTPGVDIRILDAHKKPVMPGGTGELWVRGPHVANGYYRAPEQTARAFGPDGWFNTEDLARQDPDGRVHIEGRTKDLIIRSGFNVSPLEVEMALNSHIGVRLAAVIGCAIEGNEEIVAVIEPAGETHTLVAALQDYLKTRLSPYKRPTRFVFVAALPVAPNGKVLKQQLRQIIGELS